ncbi:deoxyguanosinetriphosphate triphosphohydrolase-like protein [Terrihabitans soli]|uniref:Deoxyguanosinetriphosphate triphosphohydrolase-like protein n=1 Tax=Terrihabitans soli TaxID=708113 RepID=A0A6S6QUE4_9HYPH|nr:deoxyguanosinetriphosphate triphosphohydrolase [Terrihabitans soli]BCJ90701.1 deoxyguanosinetriphosphate triphosphohydrolase-like protein [Terrihabitans soli]
MESGFLDRPRAVYATDPAKSRGRLVAEPKSPTRTDFQRDRDRILHSAAFRRLKHKTQVFVYHEGDHYRTRLTHTLEVAQIARSLARALGLDEDLAETLALAHDLGHTPFGHAGERALDACMAEHEHFDHNAQTLRIVTRLERRYAAFDGLNLTWETLEGLVKHNGPLLNADGSGGEALPFGIAEYAKVQDLELSRYASAEAQAAAIADDIAYNAHDIDDGLRAGLFEIEDLRAVSFLSGLLDEIDTRWPGLDRSRRIHELTRRVITRFVESTIATSRANIAALNPKSVDDIRGAGRPIIGFGAEIAAADTHIKEFLYPQMYRHPWVMEVMGHAETIVKDLFAIYRADNEEMPEEWRDLGDGPARAAADFIAGMTDRYAIQEHKRLFDVTPDLG